jgi:hypothetical protein
MTQEAEIAEPIMKGRFNLFRTPDGGFHVAYQKDEEYRQEDEDDILHIEIPGMVIQAAEMASQGANPLTLLKKVMGARRGT